MQKTKQRFYIIGTGAIAASHMKVLDAMDSCDEQEIFAFDPNAEALKTFCREHPRVEPRTSLASLSKITGHPQFSRRLKSVSASF